MLTNRVRRTISVKKGTPDEWLNVHRQAHQIGYLTTATMMFGHVETRRDIVEHLDRLRTLQDETGGFFAFIPWSFKRGDTPLSATVKKEAGTGLYLRGLLRGVIATPARDSELRQRLRRIVARGGQGRLHALLERHDPGSARRISPGDTQRLVRAVEIVRSEGGSWTQRLERDGTWKSGVERYRSVKFVLDGDRGCMTERLDARVEGFFEAGLVAEVQRLLLQGVSPAANAFKAIGYREVLAAIQSGDDPDRVRDEVRRNTRRYAKRQRSWFRGEPGMIRLDVTRGLDRVIERVLEEWRRVPSRKPVDHEA